MLLSQKYGRFLTLWRVLDTFSFFIINDPISSLPFQLLVIRL